jgi:uncharacterized membrane protein
MPAEALALVWAACYGLTHPLWQAGLRRMPTTPFLAIKWVFAAAVLTGWALASGRAYEYAPGPGLALLLAAALVGPIGGWAVYSAAIRRLDLSVAHPLTNTAVLVAVAIGIVMLGERPPLVTTLLGALLIFVGVYLLQSGRLGWQPGIAVSRLGVALALGAGMCYGVNNVLWKLGVQESAIPEALWLRSAVPALLWLALWGALLAGEAARTGKARNLGRLSGAGLGFAVGAALLTDVVGFNIYFQALERGDVAVVVPLGNTAPVFSALVSFLVLREPVGPWRVLGIGCCLAGVACLTAFPK